MKWGTLNKCSIYILRNFTTQAIMNYYALLSINMINFCVPLSSLINVIFSFFVNRDGSTHWKPLKNNVGVCIDIFWWRHHIIKNHIFMWSKQNKIGRCEMKKNYKMWHYNLNSAWLLAQNSIWLNSVFVFLIFRGILL